MSPTGVKFIFYYLASLSTFLFAQKRKQCFFFFQKTKCPKMKWVAVARKSMQTTSFAPAFQNKTRGGVRAAQKSFWAVLNFHML